MNSPPVDRRTRGGVAGRVARARCDPHSKKLGRCQPGKIGNRRTRKIRTMTNPFSTDALRGARGGFVIVPGPDPLERPIRWLMVGVAGNVTVMFANGEGVTLPALQPGVQYCIEATHVTAATATGLVGGD